MSVLETSSLYRVLLVLQSVLNFSVFSLNSFLYYAIYDTDTTIICGILGTVFTGVVYSVVMSLLYFSWVVVSASFLNMSNIPFNGTYVSLVLSSISTFKMVI